MQKSTAFNRSSRLTDTPDNGRADNRLARVEHLIDLLHFAVNCKADVSSLPEMLSRKFRDLIPEPKLLERAVAEGALLVGDEDKADPRGRVDQAFDLLRLTLRLAWSKAVQHEDCFEVMDMLSLYWILWRATDRALVKVIDNSGGMTPSDVLKVAPVRMAAAQFARSMHELFVTATDVKDRMRFCANQACPTRYFVKTRRRQDYCSLQCAAEGTKEAKRKWWSKVGSKKRRRPGKARRQQRRKRR